MDTAERRLMRNRLGNEMERAAPVRAGMKNAPAPVPYILVIYGKELFYEF